jgi:hypothetical protein
VIVGAIAAVMIYAFILPRKTMKGFKKAPMPPTEFDSKYR